MQRFKHPLKPEKLVQKLNELLFAKLRVGTESVEFLNLAGTVLDEIQLPAGAQGPPGPGAEAPVVQLTGYKLDRTINAYTEVPIGFFGPSDVFEPGLTLVGDEDGTAGVFQGKVDDNPVIRTLSVSPIGSGGSGGASCAQIYECTGTAGDAAAIQNIITTFFNLGTAMTMRLIVRGTMGLDDLGPQVHINIAPSVGNVREAVCFIDFSDCDIPVDEVPARDFLSIQSTSVRLNITGLNVGATRDALYCEGSGNTFTHCALIGYRTTVSRGAVLAGAAKNNVFVDCKIYGTSTCVNIQANADNNHFTRCDLKAISNIGKGVAINSNAIGRAVFTDCTIDTAEATQFGSGFHLVAPFAGTLVLTGCKVCAGGNGILVDTANTSAVITVTNCDIGRKTTTYWPIRQSTAASTVHWRIMGNRFNAADIYVDGASVTDASNLVNAYVYMPLYANLFNQTITA